MECPVGTKDLYESQYLLLKNNYSGVVYAKFIGDPKLGAKKHTIWVPKLLVTNVLGPKLVWVPKST